MEELADVYIENWVKKIWKLPFTIFNLWKQNDTLKKCAHYIQWHSQIKEQKIYEHDLEGIIIIVQIFEVFLKKIYTFFDFNDSTIPLK